MESNLSKAFDAYYDDQPQSDGSWANAWTPVWEKKAPAHRANPYQWVGMSAARPVATFAAANAPEAEQEETLYV